MSSLASKSFNRARNWLALSTSGERATVESKQPIKRRRHIIREAGSTHWGTLIPDVARLSLRRVPSTFSPDLLRSHPIAAQLQIYHTLPALSKERYSHPHYIFQTLLIYCCSLEACCAYPPSGEGSSLSTVNYMNCFSMQYSFELCSTESFPSESNDY